MNTYKAVIWGNCSSLWLYLCHHSLVTCYVALYRKSELRVSSSRYSAASYTIKWRVMRPFGGSGDDLPLVPDNEVGYSVISWLAYIDSRNIPTHSSAWWIERQTARCKPHIIKLRFWLIAYCYFNTWVRWPHFWDRKFHKREGVFCVMQACG
jgi:hypothetical protein